MVIGKGLKDAFLTNEDIEGLLQQAFVKWDMTGQKLLVIVPDSPSSLPMPLFFRLIHKGLTSKVKSKEIYPNNIKAGQGEDLFVIPKSGEVLYRFRDK